jgi:hypothetical protein
MGKRRSWPIMLPMPHAAAVNRVLLIRDTPARANGREQKIRRYRLAVVSLAGRRTAPAKRR